MTKLEQHQLKAKSFIDNVINNSRLNYNELMAHLESKVDDWSSEYRILNDINIFELSSEQYDRKNYLSSLMTYADKLLFNHKHKRK